MPSTVPRLAGTVIVQGDRCGTHLGRTRLVRNKPTRVRCDGVIQVHSRGRAAAAGRQEAVHLAAVLTDDLPERVDCLVRLIDEPGAFAAPTGPAVSLADSGPSEINGPVACAPAQSEPLFDSFPQDR